MTVNIKFWLGRVNEEFINKAKDLLDDIMVKQYQLINFDSMAIEIQEEVIKQLHGDMLRLGWNNEALELEKSYLESKND